MDLKEIARIEQSYNTLATAIREHTSIYSDEQLLLLIDELVHPGAEICDHLAASVYMQELLRRHEVEVMNDGVDPH